MVKPNRLGVMGRPALEPIQEENADGSMALVPVEYEQKKKQRNERLKHAAL